MKRFDGFNSFKHRFATTSNVVLKSLIASPTDQETLDQRAFFTSKSGGGRGGDQIGNKAKVCYLIFLKEVLNGFGKCCKRENGQHSKAKDCALPLSAEARNRTARFALGIRAIASSSTEQPRTCEN